MTSDTVVPLTSADYNFAFKRIPPIQFLLNFEERLDTERLRSALDRVLEDFWLLRGRLEAGPGDHAVFRVPPHRRDSIPVRIEDVERLFDPTSGEQGFDFIDEASRGPGGPLARIRIGQTPHSTCLGISMAHAAGDGRSLFTFIDAWARAYSGLDYPVPTFDRTALRVDRVGSVDPPSEAYVEEATGYLYRDAEYPFAGALVRDRLVFSDSDVVAMRDEAHSQGLTLNSLLTARVWRAFSAYAPRLEPDRHTLRCPLDYRRHLPALGDGYFGSALRDAVIEMRSDEFDDAPLVELARAVHRGVHAIDAETIASLLECYERIRMTAGRRGFARLFAPGLVVTNFSRTKAAELRFAGAVPHYVLNVSLSTRTANIVPQRRGLEVQMLRRIDPLHPTPVHPTRS